MSVTQIKDGNIVSLDASKLTGNLPAISGASLTGVTGKIVQIVNVLDSTYASGTTLIPNDATIPQITEGDQYMTLAITPTSATNKLLIYWNIGIQATNGTSVCYSALFNTDTHATNALASVGSQDGGANNQQHTSGMHYMTAGVTSAMTFTIRAGNSVAGTYSFNGAAGSDRHSTSGQSSITITEIAV